MGVHYLIAGLLLLAAILVWLRPQSVSTLNHYSKEQLARVDLRRVRRTAGGGLAALAATIGGGSWLLSRAGVGDATLTVLAIVVIFAGGVIIMGRVESLNKNR